MKRNNQLSETLMGELTTVLDRAETTMKAGDSNAELSQDISAIAAKLESNAGLRGTLDGIANSLR